jgi:hypothetical protein
VCQFRLKLQNFKQYVCTHTSIDMSETLAALNSSLRPHLAASAVEGGNFSSSCVKEVAYTKVCRRSKVPNLKSYSYKMLPDLRFSRWWLRRVIFSEMWAVGFHRRFGRIYCLHLESSREPKQPVRRTEQLCLLAPWWAFCPTLNTEQVRFSEMFVYFYQTIWHQSLTELSPSWGPANCAATQELPTIL